MTKQASSGPVEKFVMSPWLRPSSVILPGTMNRGRNLRSNTPPVNAAAKPEQVQTSGAMSMATSVAAPGAYPSNVKGYSCNLQRSLGGEKPRKAASETKNEEPKTKNPGNVASDVKLKGESSNTSSSTPQERLLRSIKLKDSTKCDDCGVGVASVGKQGYSCFCVARRGGSSALKFSSKTPGHGRGRGAAKLL